jgi:hypothetical protein
MKTGIVVAAVFAGSLLPISAQAQHRVSIEVGGMMSAYSVSAYPTNSGPGATQSGLRVATSTTGTGGNVATGDQPTNAIAAFEMRPTVTLNSGLLFGVGLRIGQAGLGSGSKQLTGTDAALGYARRFGPFLPFIKFVFGFNGYEYHTDFRADAVLGSRFYVMPRTYVAAAAFGGYGDLYGGTLSVGGDLVLFPVRR